MTASARMSFVGVDTRHSAIQQVFPLWADHLRLPTRELVGIDLPLDAPDEAYLDVVTFLRDDPTLAGALVTTHKMRIYAVAGHLFDDVDAFAQACGEVSSISKHDGRLTGHAKDPITVGLSLESLLPDSYFRDNDAEVVIIGSGGSAMALSWYLAHRTDRPRSVTILGITEDALAHTRTIHQRAGLDPSLFRYRLLDSSHPAADAAAVVSSAGAATLVVNGSGVGKDRPGSPLSDDVRFPKRAVVWDFNYRGDLGLLRQARSQESDQHLLVSDGWEYFIHGWSQVVAEVFRIPMPRSTVAELGDIASAVRGALR